MFYVTPKKRMLTMDGSSRRKSIVQKMRRYKRIPLRFYSVVSLLKFLNAK